VGTPNSELWEVEETAGGRGCTLAKPKSDNIVLVGRDLLPDHSDDGAGACSEITSTSSFDNFSQDDRIRFAGRHRTAQPFPHGLTNDIEQLLRLSPHHRRRRRSPMKKSGHIRRRLINQLESTDLEHPPISPCTLSSWPVTKSLTKYSRPPHVQRRPAIRARHGIPHTGRSARR